MGFLPTASREKDPFAGTRPANARTMIGRVSRARNRGKPYTAGASVGAAEARYATLSALYRAMSPVRTAYRWTRVNIQQASRT